MRWSHRLLNLDNGEGICNKQITTFKWILYGYWELVLPHRNERKIWIGLEWEFKYCSEGLFCLGNGDVPK